MPTTQERKNPFDEFDGQDNTGNPFAVFAKRPEPAAADHSKASNPFDEFDGQDNTGNPFAVFAKKKPQPEPVPQPEAKPEYTWGETVANSMMAAGSKLNQGMLEFSAAAARRAQAPTSSALADVLSVVAAVDRGITDGWNFFGGDAKYSKSLQRQAQMASDFAAEQRAENEKNNVVAGLLGQYLDANQKAQAEYQDFDQTMNPQFAAQQQAVADAKGFWGTTRAYAQNPMAMAGDVAGSAPAMLPGAILARGVGAATLARGGTMAQATARASTAGLLAEGATSGLMGREQLYGKVSQMPYAQLMESPRFEELVKGGMSFKQARERLANELADQVTLPAAMATIAGGKLMNWLFRGDASAALLAGQKATLKTIPRNAAQEGAEEAVQSVGEEAASHRAEQQADVHADFDLGGTMARGLMTGAAMGAGGAAGSALDWRGRKGAGAAAAQAQGEGDELDDGPGEGPQQAAPAAQQAFSREGYVQYRRTLESGGNPQAKAKTSSAFGIDQFLDGTWLDVVAQAKPDWAEGLTREQLLAQRANPQRSGEMADFLDRQNAQRLQSQGLEVNNHNLYAMHHFGAKGLTFAKAAMDAPMAQILTEAQLKANPYLAKMSKAQLIAHWDKRAGVPTAAGHDTPSTRVQIDDAPDARAAEIEVLQSMGENLTDAQRARLGQLQAEEAAAQPARSFEQELAEAAELDGQAQQAGQAQSVPGRAAEMVLQNRDRSTAASIEQMNAIAAKPDYLRTGPSRTMDQGAPVVFGDFPASSILGREETVADGRGDRVKTRYAVVDAADVIPSNTADGLPVQSYAAGEPGKLRAVAGNGRAAGLIEAYNRGTAGQYRQELMEDAQSLGIEPAHIERLQSPMLVRIMDEADVTPDIGDRSNTAATARLSPLEEASNDAKRVNLAALEFGEDGSPTAASLRGFINAMPEAERGNMLGPDGAPTRQAVDRLMAAAFKQAYGNDELVKLHAQATDPEARTVMAALADSAGAMAQLAGAGEFDIRQAVADAAALAVNARRKGRTLAQEVQNLDLDMNPEALVIAQFMAQNIRSARRIADGLRNFAQRALQQVQIAEQNAVQGGMFGDQPTLTRKQLFEEFGNAHQQPAAQPGAARAESGQAPAAQPGRAGPDAQLAQPERAHARAAGDRPADRAQGGAAAGQEGRVEAAAGAAAGPGSADRPDVRLSRQKGQAQELGQTQQQYKDTERAYGGRAAYDRAKAAGKTKLSYGQWVQVRTPNFKQWFGDWEAVRAQERLDAMRPVEVDLPDALRGASLEQLREAVKARLDALAESGAVAQHPDVGEIGFSKGNNKKALSTSAAPEKLHAAHDIVRVIESAVHVGSALSGKPDEVGHGTTYHTLAAKVRAAGKEFVAVVTVKQSPEGKKFYNTVALASGQEKAPAAYPGDRAPVGVGSATAFTGASRSVLPAMRRVNPADVSKVIDPETGEPLVVYHGTSEPDLTVFDLMQARQNADIPSFFFSTQREEAEGYGDNVLEAFLNIRNPVEKPDANMRGSEVRKELEAQGVDGTIVDDYWSVEYAAFRPTQIKSAIGNSGDFDAQNPDIRYSRQQQAAGQQRAEQVRRTVDGIRRHWKNAPEVVVAASLHDEAIPEELRSAVQAKQGQGAPEGFFHDGKVYLIADRLPKPRDVARVLLHEALGHWGLRGVFGKRLTLVLRDIQAARPQEVIAKAREYGLHGLGQAKEASNSEIWKSMSQEQRDEAAEEVLASMAQHQPQLGFVRRAVAAMRSWLREHVPLFNELALTQDEIVNNYLLPARRWVERSAKAGVAGGRPALSRSRPRQASDAEKARILQGEPVARLDTGNAPVGAASIRQWASGVFRRQGGKAVHPVIGEVLLDDRAVRNSLAHKRPNQFRVAAFAAVKDVLESGVLVLSAQHGDVDSYFVSAPVALDGVPNIVTVLVHKDAQTQRMYLHSVTTKENLLNHRLSRADAAASERSGSTGSGDDSSLNPNVQGRKADSAEVAAELRRLLTLDVQAGPQDIRFSRSQRVRAAANAALDKVGDWMDDSLDIPEHWSPAEKSAASKFDRYSKKQPLSERVREIGHNARDRVVQGVVDQFRPLKGLSKTAWMQAQLSKGTDGAVEAVATLGIPVLKDGAIAVETDQYPEGFLGELSKQLGSTEEVRNFFMYVVGNRADRLSKEWTVTYADGTTVRYKDQATALQAAKGKPGAKAQAASRENLFNAEEIEAMKNKLYGKMANGRPRPEAYHNALVALNRYNRSILDIAEAAGLIDPESRKQWESDFYVPFYRVSAENNTAFDFSSKGTGLARQQVIRRLEGGTDKLGDPLENLMANWHAMLTASMRNLAANNALNAAQSMGEARQVSEPVEGGTWTMQGGKKVYWQVDDPLVLIALESLNFNGYNNALMRTAGKAKHMLTVGVTASPVFRIRNLIRDTLQATATADVGYNPIGNALEGLALTAKGSDTRAQLIAGGGAVRFGSFNDGNQAQHYERMIAKGIEEGQILDTPQKIRQFFGDALNNYQEVGDRIEMVNRAVIYQRALAEGKSHLEASFEARDLMNFTSMGSFAAVRAIAQVVPFANARVQGMDRLVRGAARDPRRFWAVTGLIGMASAALYLLNADDDEYRAMPDYIRNTYWPVKMGGKWYYIPKPFEVGAMGTVVERFTELVFSDGDYQVKDFKDSVMSILMNSLSMNLTPQLIKPAAEAWFNYDMFREQAIEGMALERLLPEDRYDANTSAAAIAAGRALGASPKKIEHLIRGYFGWLGVQALNAGDWMARPMMDLPESPKSDLSSVNNWFVVGDMVKDSGTIPSKYAERFYRLQSEINEIYASASNARRLGELQRYQELVSRPEMAAYPVLHQAQKGVTLINQQMRLTLASSAPAAEKNRRLQELRARRDEIARRVDKIVREAQMGRKGG